MMSPTDLRRARETLGLSQTGLAEALGMTGKWKDRSVRGWEQKGATVPLRTQKMVEQLLARHEMENPLA